jgi:hypothetical protein
MPVLATNWPQGSYEVELARAVPVEAKEPIRSPWVSV